MACGSVAQKETAIGREIASIKLTRSDLTSPSSAEINSSTSNSGKSRSSRFSFRGDDVHEAVKFLQQEHEKVLGGLHKQIESLQQKYKDLQFASHTRHVTSKEEDYLRKRLKESLVQLKEKTKEAEKAQQLLQEHKAAAEEERQQFRWQEIQLQQQIEVSDQRSADLKAEVSMLKAQVHDLQVYCSHIRTGEGSRTVRTSQSRSTASSPRPLYATGDGQLRASSESLESSGPRSLGSEDGAAGAWKEARLGSSRSRVLNRSFRAQSSPSGSNLNFSQTISLPPVKSADGQSRPPSGIVTLPPITHTQAITRSQVRRQLRLSSAPNLDSNANMKPQKTSRPPP